MKRNIQTQREERFNSRHSTAMAGQSIPTGLRLSALGFTVRIPLGFTRTTEDSR